MTSAALAQAEIKPRMSVLGIGSGGSNAALLAELVGPDGHVTTMDIDPWVIDRARRFLADDYPEVTVLHADAEHGVPDAEPWDRIIVTVDAPDIPPAWTPSRPWRPTRGTAHHSRADLVPGVRVGWHAARWYPAQADGIRGNAGPRRAERASPALVQDQSVELLIDDEPSATQIELGGPQAAFTGRRVDADTGVKIGAVEPFDDLELWIASQTETLALLRADKPVIESGVVEKPATRGAKRLSPATRWHTGPPKASPQTDR